MLLNLEAPPPSARCKPAQGRVTMTSKNNPQHRWRGFLRSTCLLGAISFSGCSGLSMFSQPASAQDRKVASDPGSIDKIMGPTERRLRSEHAGLSAEDEADLANARTDYNRAIALFDEGRYAEAEKEFKKIIKQRRDSYESMGAKIKNFWGIASATGKEMYEHFGDPVEEDALFMQAESQYAQKKYVQAQNSYDDLLNRYPSTRHMDRVTRQMFRIARYWLDFPGSMDGGSPREKVQLASNSERTAEDLEPGAHSSMRKLPLVPNVVDKTRPVYDAHGRGLQALRSIWLHDATGPLADDALMLAANHNLRVKNFVEAKRLYELIREQYPDSPHLKDAYLLGSHVTLASYEGPEYDGRSLDKARDLKQSMLQIFPDLSEQERKMLQSEIDQMHSADIARLWSQVEFYQRKNIPESIALHCNLIINRYPNSEYAHRARAVLRELQQQQNRSGQSVWAWGSGQKPAPAKTAQVPGNDRSTDPRSQVTPSENRERSSESTVPSTDAQKRSIFGFLRKAEEPPKLQAPPEPTDDAGKATL